MRGTQRPGSSAAAPTSRWRWGRGAALQQPVRRAQPACSPCGRPLNLQHPSSTQAAPCSTVTATAPGAATPTSCPCQVEDFEEAERTLRRHGVEYARFVLPGGWVEPRELWAGGLDGWARQRACQWCWRLATASPAARPVHADIDMKQLFFYDPEGNGVELGEYEDTWCGRGGRVALLAWPAGPSLCRLLSCHPDGRFARKPLPALFAAPPCRRFLRQHGEDKGWLSE